MMAKRETLYEVVIEGQRVPVQHPNRFILFLRAWDAEAGALVWQVSNVGDKIEDLHCWFSVWRGMPHFRVLDRKTGEIFEPKLELAKIVHPEDTVVPDLAVDTTAADSRACPSCGLGCCAAGQCCYGLGCQPTEISA